MGSGAVRLRGCASDNGRTVVVLFVRHPVPGRVKTRLAQDLGPVAACSLYGAMVEDVLAAAGESRYPLHLYHDGQDETVLPDRWTQGAERVCRQQGATLGERICRAVEASFEAGFDRVIVTGSDIPGMDGRLLMEASHALLGSSVVLSPAVDGGYCLIGVRKSDFSRLLFRDIPWSSSGVLASTLAVCSSGRLSYRLLEGRRDIDTLADLLAYCREPSVKAPATNRWLAANGFITRLPVDFPLNSPAPP